ncbi:hypothetical protein [Carboxydocella sp. JDF658]|uniref:hypothetical protein n=1 Tax=Carboxydocella sp. JDF658 TaxID=1926600 RepID=UPI0009AE4E9D|nr:hypothetical protein [Carboxydocella sp. JDF658]GAW32368.1 hypothetical protein JDF658_21330 [Carboxydocella sp. JDF658]
MKKKIGIIDADLLDNGTRHPNLALMKISGYMKEKGHDVKLILDYREINEGFDKIYISKVFSFTKVPDIIFNFKNIEKGGTGFYPDGGPSLREEIEHHMPDYSLYNDYIEREIAKGRNPKSFTDYTDYSIGFTTRGCFRKCEFCVNKKYDRVVKHSPVSEFLDPNRKGIYLWDDNFLGYSKWYEILDELEATGKPFQFRQGLDLRLMTEEKAKRLSKVKYKGDFIFAFDFIEDSEIIQKKLKLWRKYCNKTTKLYLLSGYLSQDETDIENLFERIKILMKFGCLPYVMRHERYLASKYKGLYISITRWCNQPRFFKKMSFREFCEANQKYKKTNIICSTFKSMLDFEKEHPLIAKKYFDLKFDKLNEY